MATAFVIISAVSFGLLLPFLLLSFANAFYRERLKEVLRLADDPPPSAPQPPLPGPGSSRAVTSAAPTAGIRLI